MIGAGIHEDALRYLVQQHAVREAVAGRINGGPTWGLSIRLGGPAARLVAVRSRRETVRTWASLTAVGKFAEQLGLAGFTVEL
jgi:hypothetical protein